MTTLKWLHLSDIHFNFKTYETDWLRDSLKDTLEDFKDIDFLVITGDLLYKFKSSFDEVESFIREIIDILNISLEKVFIVPGNHDFERDEDRALLIQGLKQPIEEVTTRVSNLNPKSKKRLVEGQKDFWDFHVKLLGRECNYEEIHFVDKHDKFNIININTCIISGLEKEEGMLSIDMKSLGEVLRKVKKSDKPNIAIGHHSLECFVEKERKQIAQMFEDYSVDIYLCGHMHKSNYVIDSQGNRAIRSLVCGSAMTDSYADPTFIYGTINLNSYDCSVKYYKWYDNNHEWRRDFDVNRKVLDDGSIEFNLDRLKKKEINESIAPNDILDRKIDKMIEGEIEPDKFQRFLLKFCKSIRNYSLNGGDININKDVHEKFYNMKCSSTFQTQFDRNAGYFPLVDDILADPAYIDYDRIILIPGVITSKYDEVIEGSSDGSQVLNRMVESLAHEYKDEMGIPLGDLKQYFKTIIFWSLNKCDIYNECI
ncbi:MAG: metallophosphoesterase [Peptostreptococcaceae bacterium]